MKHSNFVHLHTHTEYSLLDGMTRIPTLVSKAKEFKMPALAMTDHGVLFGAIQFYQQAQKAGIKPIVGCEIYVAPKSRFDKTTHGMRDASFHLILLAMDDVGYRNLIKLSTAGYLEGFYYKPRIDKEILAEHSKGLIGLSACLKGEIPRLLAGDEPEQAQQVASEYSDIFGKENFYLELMDQGIEAQPKVNKALVELSKNLGIKLVATNDCHYMRREDSRDHEILLCIQTGTNMEDPNRMKLSTDEFYFKSPEEMTKLFKDVPEAIERTIEIAEKCNLSLEFGESHLPHYKVPDGYKIDTYLRELCLNNTKNRYPDVTDEIKDRLDLELDTVLKMGLGSYFLIVWDFVNYAKENRIPVGPGRGSAAGSLIAYVLGITDIDPLKYGLLFERFLNPERISLPDIDIDFCYERRDEVINYVTKKYGEKNVAQVITFGTMMARAAVRDVGRALNMPYAEVDRIAKMIPFGSGVTIKGALEGEPELKDLADKDERVTQLLNSAMNLEGMSRHASTHAAGVVISEKELTTIAPLFSGSRGEVTTQYAMSDLEKIGLLKMDFLGLRTLTVINETIGIIKRTQEIEVDISKIPLDDSAAFKLLNDAETIGVFQLESSGMRDLSKKIGLDILDDLIALVALFRPGPMHMLDDYVKRKHGKVAIKYDHELLEPILKDTYGIMLYQEQIMKIANELGGFSLAQADLLRRAMGKKVPEVMEKERQNFIEGASLKSVSQRAANKIFDSMAYFSGYGFNKSHSTAYAMIAYQTAYLKANYPVAFMCALLTSEVDNTDKVVQYISECGRMGIKVLPPDVNESFAKFTVVESDIRFGLAAVKNVGWGAIMSITEERKKNGKFKTIYDFCERVDLRLVNKKVVESLVKCGAFDSMGAKRSQLMAVLDYAIESAQSAQKDRMNGQTSFIEVFEGQESFAKDFQELPDIPGWHESKMLAFEKETLGFYITGHPLARYEGMIRNYATATTVDLELMNDGDEVGLGGIIVRMKNIRTKKGERMAFIDLEDLEGITDVVVFPKVFEKSYEQLRNDNLVFVRGRIDFREDKPKVIANDIFPIEEVKMRLTKQVHINLRTQALEEEALMSLREILISYPGDCLVYLHMDSKKEQTTMMLDQNLRVKPKSELVKEIENLLGEGCVTLKA